MSGEWWCGDGNGVVVPVVVGVSEWVKALVLAVIVAVSADPHHQTNHPENEARQRQPIRGNFVTPHLLLVLVNAVWRARVVLR